MYVTWTLEMKSGTDRFAMSYYVALFHQTAILLWLAFVILVTASKPQLRVYAVYAENFILQYIEVTFDELSA